MKFETVLTITLIIMLSGITSAKAEDTGGMTTGSKVRIRSGGKVYTGTLSTIGDKRITLLSMDRSEEKTFSPEGISKIERSIGTGSHWKRGALIGGGVGLVWCIIAFAPDDDPVDDFLLGTGSKIVGTGMTVTAGAAAGGLIGLLFKTERWEDVPVGKGFDISVLPAPDGGYMTLSFSF